MITADQAREYASVPAKLKDLSAKNEKAAKDGECGIWVSKLSFPVIVALRDLGYELSHGGSKDENGIDRKNQTWIWWGNHQR